MKSAPQSRQKDIVIQELNGELLVYDLSLNRAFCLNHPSAIVWQSCDGKKTISEIAQIVGKMLNTQVTDEFVWLALERLKKENLILNGEEIAPMFEGLSRREVIKRVGFSSMIALPVVTSIIAPAAVHAASGTCGQACQCSGLLAPVSVCPPNFADCPQDCQFCNIPQGGCFDSGDGVIACNGTCSNQSQSGPTCPTVTPCQCIGNGNSGVSSCSAALGGCPGTCNTCVSPIGSCFKPGGEGAFVCPGTCA